MDGTLTFLRANEKAGAFKRTIAFARGVTGLTCTANDSIVREEGADGIVVNSVMNGVPTTIIREKLISSSCRVTKQN